MNVGSVLLLLIIVADVSFGMPSIIESLKCRLCLVQGTRIKDIKATLLSSSDNAAVRETDRPS